MRLCRFFVVLTLAGCGTVESRTTTDASGAESRTDAGAPLDSPAEAGADSGPSSDAPVVEEACLAKDEYAECMSQKYLVPYLADPMKWESIFESMPNPDDIAPRTATVSFVVGRCVAGTCCSGCVKDGKCIPVSTTNHLILPPGQPNECGVNANTCVDCNAATTKRACQYTISGSVPFVSLTSGACVD